MAKDKKTQAKNTIKAMTTSVDPTDLEVSKFIGLRFLRLIGRLTQGCPKHRDRLQWFFEEKNKILNWSDYQQHGRLRNQNLQAKRVKGKFVKEVLS